MRDAPWARLYIDELCNFPKSEFTDQVDSTTQFINWAKGSLGWSRIRREEDERFRRDRIARGLPVRYDDNGQPVFVCAYTGCEKELLPGTTIYGSRSLPFCSLVHSF